MVNEVDFIPPIDFVGQLVDLSVSGLGGWIRVPKRPAEVTVPSTCACMGCEA